VGGFWIGTRVHGRGVARNIQETEFDSKGGADLVQGKKWDSGMGQV